MLASHRQPEDCCWREVDNADGTIECRLVRELVDPGPTGVHRISREACVACCQKPEPTRQAPGEVVASLGHDRLQARLREGLSPANQVAAQEQMIWIEQFLNDSRAPSSPAGQSDSAAQHRGFRTWLNHWQRRIRRKPRIGLAGSNDLKGIGHLNRDLVRWLRIVDWLLPPASVVNPESSKDLTSRAEHIAHDDGGQSVARFLDRIDLLVFVERPPLAELTKLARTRGIKVVCIPMWEWLHPGLPWLVDVDLMLCPTVYTQRLMDDWKSRFGFQWQTRLCTWPIDVGAFPFQVRKTCQRFVMVNGAPFHARRKGLDLLFDAARQLPHIPFLVWSQVGDLQSAPGNVEVRLSTPTNRELYAEGDVCVQLSRWEGLGLPLLECQAAGLPLITLDAAPMNEHNPVAVVPVVGQELLEIWHRRSLAVPQARSSDVAEVLNTWFGRDIEQASRTAREFVEREHSWARSRPLIQSALTDCYRSVL